VHTVYWAVQARKVVHERFLRTFGQTLVFIEEEIRHAVETSVLITAFAIF